MGYAGRKALGGHLLFVSWMGGGAGRGGGNRGTLPQTGECDMSEGTLELGETVGEDSTWTHRAQDRHHPGSFFTWFSVSGAGTKWPPKYLSNVSLLLSSMNDSSSSQSYLT